MSYPLRVTIEDGTKERLHALMVAEKRKESNAVELLLTEALDSRDEKIAAARKKAKANA